MSALRTKKLQTESDVVKRLSDLEKKVSELKSEIATLRDEIRERPIAVEQAYVSAVTGVTLVMPIPVTLLEYPDDDWVVSWPEANLYGSGDTRSDAFAMFKREVVSLCEDVREGWGSEDDELQAIISCYIEYAANKR